MIPEVAQLADKLEVGSVPRLCRINAVLHPAAGGCCLLNQALMLLSSCPCNRILVNHCQEAFSSSSHAQIDDAAVLAMVHEVFPELQVRCSSSCRMWGG